MSRHQAGVTLVTGAAGFIGSAVVLSLLNRGETVIGLDNHNAYYDPGLKESRLARYSTHPRYTHYRADLADKTSVDQIFETHQPRRVVNLGAQAGVRYSIDNPLSYIESNIVGFAHVLEACRRTACDHLVYASSSSVYGNSTRTPHSTQHQANHPASLYAATKKSNELMAHAYSHLYQLPTTGLRFFTVYGPWGRPDMALFKFTQAILANEPIDIYNKGMHSRDFTYIDDVVDGILGLLDKPPGSSTRVGQKPLSEDGVAVSPLWRVFNVGNRTPVPLLDFIATLEWALEKPARRNLLNLQAGDVIDTCADIDDLTACTGWKPRTSIAEGIPRFVDWYLRYYSTASNRTASQWAAPAPPLAPSRPDGQQVKR